MAIKTIETTKKIIKERAIQNFFRTVSYSRKNVVDDLLTDRPYEFSPSWEKKFFEAMKWSFRHHYRNCEFYRKVCIKNNFDEKRLGGFGDIWDIPHVLSDVFKMYDIQTRTGDMLRAEMSSSGTSGRRSKIMLNMLSGNRLLYSIYYIYKALGLVNATPANYILMAYNPSIDENIATTNSDIIMTYLTPRREIFYALDSKREGRVEFLKDEAVDRLRRYMDEGLPVRMLGFIHHMCEVLKSYKERYGRAAFPRESCVISGGGWKNFSNPCGDKFSMVDFFKEYTTLDPRNIRDLYTLNEHAVFYLECEEHNKHIPNVALACARDPRTMARLDYGQTGLIHLYSPLIESCPVLSLLTTDYGYIGKSCGCSLGGPYIKIIGRAGVTKKVTCAFTADQYVKETVKR